MLAMMMCPSDGEYASPPDFRNIYFVRPRPIAMGKEMLRTKKEKDWRKITEWEKTCPCPEMSTGRFGAKNR